jgi:hypothetical protein
MGLLYGRAGRLTAENAGFRPGQEFNFSGIKLDGCGPHPNLTRWAEALNASGRAVLVREKQIGGSGGSLDPPRPLLTHLHTVHTAYSECLPTRLNPLAERTCFSQVLVEDCHWGSTVPLGRGGGGVAVGPQDDGFCRGLDTPSECPYNLYRASGDTINTCLRRPGAVKRP